MYRYRSFVVPDNIFHINSTISIQPDFFSVIVVCAPDSVRYLIVALSPIRLFHPFFFFVDFLLSNFLPISFCSFECLHTQMRIGKSLGYIFKIASIEMLKSITGENWIHVRVFSFFLLLLSSTLFSFSIDSFFLVFNEKEKSLSHWKIERILFQVYYHLFQSHEKVSSWFHFDQSHSMKRSD